MPEHATIRRLPLKGVGGLFFTAAMVLLGVVYVPVMRWLVAVAVPAGVGIAVALRFWHKHAPVSEPENKKVLNLDR